MNARIPRRTSLRIALFAIPLSLIQAAAYAQGCPVSPGDFVRTQLVGSEMNEPMELEVDHEGNVYWVERKTGNLQIYDAGSKSVVKAGTVPTYMNGTGRNESNSVGLIGLALAPDFAASRKVYLTYSPEPAAGRRLIRVSRFALAGTRLDLASEETIIEFEASYACCHQGGSLEFGPDGVLYVGTGDNLNTDASDAASLAGPYATSMDPKNQNGKILRIVPKPGPGGGYTVPPGNLYADPAQGNPEIYVMGNRNAYRISADPRTGWVYWGDIGPDGPRMEEINQVRNEPGNYGWPAVLGDNEPTVAHGSYAALGARPPLKAPIISYNGNTDKVRTGPAATAGMGIRGRAGWAGPIYYYDGASPSTSKFPPSLHGTLVIFDWQMDWIKSIHFNDQGYVQSAADFPDFNWAHMIDMKFSAAGELYVLDYGSTFRVNNSDDGLYKISYKPPDPAACLPRAAELDSRTIGGAKPVAAGPFAARRHRNAEFVRGMGSNAWADAALAFPGGGSGEILIRDLGGRVVSRLPAGNPGRERIAVTAPIPGVYLVEARSAAGSRTQKVFLSGTR
jgi:cytochrome c